MKSHLLTLILAVCLSSVMAQSLPGLPDCAQDCATGAIPSKCSPVDVECICATRSFVDDMACCVGKSCNADDQKIVSQAALDFANGICGGAGVSDLPQSATCGSDATTTAATTTATVTNTETTTSDGKTTTTTATYTETATSTTESDQTSSETSTEAASTSADTSTQTSTSTETETPANAEDTDGATLLRGKSVGVLAGIVAGVAIVL
ncbi:hypothetical protein BDW72DRAFT_193590 [Aspergillus terricola var. indicus]